MTDHADLIARLRYGPTPTPVANKDYLAAAMARLRAFEELCKEAADALSNGVPTPDFPGSAWPAEDDGVDI